MQLKYVAFSLPIHQNPDRENELNAFLSMNKIITVNKDLIHDRQNSTWVFLVEYMKDGETKADTRFSRPKVDYRELLNDEEFAVFSKLRELRKARAEQEAIPVYSIFTNEQLYTMIKEKVTTKTAMGKISGIGESRIEKYATDFLHILKEAGNEKESQPLQ